MVPYTKIRDLESPPFRRHNENLKLAMPSIGKKIVLARGTVKKLHRFFSMLCRISVNFSLGKHCVFPKSTFKHVCDKRSLSWNSSSG